MHTGRTVTIRIKILIVAAVLLLMFALTNAVSVLLNKDVVYELEAMAEYHMPLNAIAAEIDVQTFEFEINLQHLLQQHTLELPRLTAIAARQAELATHLEQTFDRAARLISIGVTDTRKDIEDRIALARIAGTFTLIQRQLKPFVELGTAVLEALRGHRTEEAQQLVRGFAAFEQAFGPDLAQIRTAISELTQSSSRETAQHELHILFLSVGLFCVAALCGLGLCLVLTRHLAGAFRRLLNATHAVEAGQLTVELPVRSNDEFGQLTRSFNHMVVELQAKERIKNTFGQFMDPRIVSGLIDMSSENPEAAERRTITVFFSDIKGFSSLSEQLTAQAMVNLLNAYFTATTQAIREHRGILDKYIGDGVMAFWAPPFSAGDQHAIDACLAALDQQQAIAAFRRELPQILGLRRHVPDFIVRMGLATGEVVMGTIGSATAKSYTVIGDIVNVASRLERINKLYRTELIIAEETYRLTQHTVETRELDLVAVVGKTEPVHICELQSRIGDLAPERSELRSLFAEGLAAYRQCDWACATQKFQACLKLVPDDGPSQLFERRVAQLRTTPPPGDWNGVWQATEK